MSLAVMWFMMGVVLSTLAVSWRQRLLYVALGPLALVWHIVVVPGRQSSHPRSTRPVGNHELLVISSLKEYSTVSTKRQQSAEAAPGDRDVGRR
jgi:hypothetical protein